MKDADEILKELAECDNPVTSSSLKNVAIAKLKQERDKYRKALDALSNLHYKDEQTLKIITEAMK